MRWKQLTFAIGGLLLPAAFVVGGAVILVAAIAGHDSVFRAPPLKSVSVEALMIAVKRNDLARTYELLRAGVDPDAVAPFRDKEKTDGRIIMASALYRAAARDNENLVLVLLQNGASLEAENNLTAICAAARSGGVSTLEVLRAFSANPNPPSKCLDGETPLGAAQSRSHEAAAALLRTMGAQPNY